MTNRIASLDFLRFLAILSVVSLHSLEFLHDIPELVIKVFSYGWIGVDLFFVLSGFLIGRQAFTSSADDQHPVRHFILKRFFRTLPLYYFVLLVYLFIKPIGGFPFNDTKIKYFFFLQNFLNPKDFVQSWSLCIEEQFYILFPLLIFSCKLKKIPSYFWLLPGILSILFRTTYYYMGVPADTITSAAYNYHFTTITHLDGLSWGIFLASSYDSWIKIKLKTPFAIFGFLLLIISLMIIGPYNINEQVIFGYQLLAIAFSCMLVGLYELQLPIAGKLIQHIATWSYGIYLWNNLISRVTVKALYHQSNFLKLLFFVVVTVTLSAATYYLIEKPALKWRSRFLPKN